MGETLQCHREGGNVHNVYAVSIKKGSTIVGHIPKKLLCLCSLFLRQGGNICCEVTGLWCYSSEEQLRRRREQARARLASETPEQREGKLYRQRLRMTCIGKC